MTNNNAPPTQPTVEEVVGELRAVSEYFASEVFYSDYNKHAPTIDRAISLLSALEKDALRYLWLRRGGCNDFGADYYRAYENDGYGGSQLKFENRLDEAIDTAIDLAREQS